LHPSRGPQLSTVLRVRWSARVVAFGVREGRIVSLDVLVSPKLR
jgi:hypothetical protein